MENYQTMSPEQKEEFWQNHIKAWQHSGLNMKQYSEQHGLKARTFGSWKNKLLAPQSEQILTEIPSHIISTVSSQNDTLEIILQNGLTIRIGPACSPVLLRQVLETLGVKA